MIVVAARGEIKGHGGTVVLPTVGVLYVTGAERRRAGQSRNFEPDLQSRLFGNKGLEWLNAFDGDVWSPGCYRDHEHTRRVRQTRDALATRARRLRRRRANCRLPIADDVNLTIGGARRREYPRPRPEPGDVGCREVVRLRRLRSAGRQLARRRRSLRARVARSASRVCRTAGVFVIR